MKINKQKPSYLTRNKPIIELSFFNGTSTGLEVAQNIINAEVCKLKDDSREYDVLKRISLQIDLEIQQEEMKIDQQIKVIDEAIKIKARQKRINNSPLRKVLNKIKNPSTHNAGKSE